MTHKNNNFFKTISVQTILPDGGIQTRTVADKGDIQQTKYSVFPGINIIYNDIHISSSFSSGKEDRSNLFEINHCREGRLECHVGDDYFYISPGDISMHLIHCVERAESFPTNHYHGVTVQIDLNLCPENLSAFLPDVEARPEEIVKKFNLLKNYFYILRRMPEIEHIFSELYVAPETVKKGYFKLKILELMLFLNSITPPTDQTEQYSYSAKQVNMAHSICEYIDENLDKKITLQSLSCHFDVSPSYIKNVFNGVYGVSVTKYLRNRRMTEAAKLLKETDRTVLDISCQFGYENSSKFAAAFRNVIGVSPTQYRRRAFHNNAKDI